MRTDLDRCSSWRSLISSELDGELGEFDVARVEHHVARCPSCAAWRAEVGSLTAVLRESELEMPERPLEVRALRRGFGRIGVFGATGASVAAAALVAVVIGLPVGGPAGSAQASSSSAAPWHWYVHHGLGRPALDSAVISRPPGVLNRADQEDL